MGIKVHIMIIQPISLLFRYAKKWMLSQNVKLKFKSIQAFVLY